jgi:phage FluMu protein Com
MTNEEFSYNDAVICKRCKTLFHFGASVNLIEGLKFPNGDFSLIKAKCPRCYSQSTYQPSEVKRSGSSEDKDELIKQLRNQISQLTFDKSVCEDRFKKLLDDYQKFVTQVGQVQTQKNEVQTEQIPAKKTEGVF